MNTKSGLDNFPQGLRLIGLNSLQSQSKLFQKARKALLTAGRAVRTESSNISGTTSQLLLYAKS